MEAIITIVGFLGAGKTTLLRSLVSNYLENDWEPFVILNDYENAQIDADQLAHQINPKFLQPLSGSCICCSGINELREFINNVPPRNKGLTIIEANGTSDACALNGFLGVGLNQRFLPPIQISVIDSLNWQKRGNLNELESNQIQVSSLIVLNHKKPIGKAREMEIIKSIEKFNPLAKIIKMDDINIELLPHLLPSKNTSKPLDHQKAHWSSCSIDMPILPNTECIQKICDALPESIIRVKGCVKIHGNKEYTYFDRSIDSPINIKPFYGKPITGPKLLTIGPGSQKSVLESAIAMAL